MIYSYSVSGDTSGGNVDTYYLETEILKTTIIPAIEYTKSYEDVIEIKFESALTAEDKTILDGVLAAHNADPLIVYKEIVQNAIAFFNELMVNYAAENITMGITVYNKTKDVADYLVNVMRYGQSGSLYEVIHEIDALIAAGIPADLDPYANVARLTEFKNKVEVYLGVS